MEDEENRISKYQNGGHSREGAWLKILTRMMHCSSLRKDAASHFTCDVDIFFYHLRPFECRIRAHIVPVNLEEDAKPHAHR